MRQIWLRRRILTGAMFTMAVVLAAGCGGDDSTAQADVVPSDQSAGRPDGSASTDSSDSSGCGVSLDDVIAVLPPDTPVGQNDTPDPARCNFTWSDADGGNWAIDVILLRGGRAQLEATDKVPADADSLKDGTPYQSVDGVGDEAWAINEGGVNVAMGAVKGDDAAVVDMVFEDFGRNVDFTTGPGTPLGVDSLDVCIALAKQALS